MGGRGKQIYQVSSGTARAVQRNPVSKHTHTHTHTQIQKKEQLTVNVSESEKMYFKPGLAPGKLRQEVCCKYKGILSEKERLLSLINETKRIGLWRKRTMAGS